MRKLLSEINLTVEQIRVLMYLEAVKTNFWGPYLFLYSMDINNTCKNLKMSHQISKCTSNTTQRNHSDQHFGPFGFWLIYGWAYEKNQNSSLKLNIL